MKEITNEEFDKVVCSEPCRATISSIVPKIVNGSKITIGKDLGVSTIIVIDKHFNWFQKKMIKWCFGFDVEDYTTED